MLRGILHRLAVVVVGLSVGIGILVVTEIGLRLAGIGEGAPRRDPFAGFSSVVPLFEPAVQPDGTHVYRLSGARVTPPKDVVTEPQRRFLAQKPEGTFRIFAIGGSSTAGVPYSTDEAFPAWLARRLEAELRDVDFEVVNAAMPGYATRRELVVVRELAQYQPDLLILYTGHNEFAERRFYAHLLDMDPRLFRLWERAVRTHLYTACSRALSILRPAPPEATRLRIDDARDSQQMFAVGFSRLQGQRTASGREVAYREILFRFNIEEMIRTMHGVGARTMILSLSQNFADWPPGSSSHRRGASAEQKAAWRAAVREGDRLARDDCARALEAYARALAIDDSYAFLQYRVARCERELGKYDAARERFRLASDLDQIPAGAPTRYNEILRDVARAEGALFVDIDAVLTRASAHGLVGNDFFADPIHPNIAAHREIAAAVAEALRDAGIPVPAARWKPEAYVEPPLAAVYAGNPRLKLREHLSRAVVYMLGARDEQALTELRAALSIDPQDEAVTDLTQQLMQRRER
jgi:lysophospholipase L1-like esterase